MTMGYEYPPGSRQRMREIESSYVLGPKGPLNPETYGKQNTTNDYVQTGLLAAIFMQQLDAKRDREEQRKQEELDHWADVVEYRMGISDPIAVRQKAHELWEFDTTEAQAYKDRVGTGLPYALGSNPNKSDAHTLFLWKVLLWGVIGAVATFMLMWVGVIVTAILGVSDGIDWNTVWVVMMCAWGLWTIVYWYQRAWRPAYTKDPAGLVGEFGIYDPREHSELCRLFPPGSTIVDIAGNEYTVYGWPVYLEGSLVFRYPVDRHTPMTFTREPEEIADGTMWIGAWLGTSKMDWDASVALIGDRGEYEQEWFEEWLRVTRRMTERKR